MDTPFQKTWKWGFPTKDSFRLRLSDRQLPLEGSPLARLVRKYKALIWGVGIPLLGYFDLPSCLWCEIGTWVFRSSLGSADLYLGP